MGVDGFVMTVEALKDIGKRLGKKWDFSVDPCSGERNWSGNDNNITWAYDIHNGTVCHVTRM